MTTFAGCLYAAASNAEFVAEFDRLYGHNLSRRGLPIELLVDDSAGRTDAACAEFIAFVWHTVYQHTAAGDRGMG